VIAGTVDCFASHHIPQNSDNKVCEFEYAKNGMIGLETLFGAILSVTGNPSTIIELLTVSPRKIFGLSIPEMKVGAPANLTLFDTTTEFIFDESMIKSKSKNSAFVEKKLKGKVIGIINGNKIALN
jgi:dihydroorotase